MELCYEACCCLMADVVKVMKKDYIRSLKYCATNKNKYTLIAQKIMTYKTYMAIEKTKRVKLPKCPKPLSHEKEFERRYLAHYLNIVNSEFTMLGKDWEILTLGYGDWKAFIKECRAKAKFSL